MGIRCCKVFIKCVFFDREVGSGGYVLSFGLVQFLFEKAPPGGGFTTPQLRRFIFYSLFFILYFLFFIFYCTTLVWVGSRVCLLYNGGLSFTPGGKYFGFRTLGTGT